MALPATDNFNRANGGLGANWSTPTGGSALAITSNAVYRGSVAYCMQYWNADAFANDHYSECTISTSAYQVMGPAVRMQSGSSDCYFLFASVGGTTVAIGYMLNKAYNSTLASFNVGFANGALLRLQAVGSTLTAFVDGNNVGNVTDTNLASGYPGLHNASGVGSLDNWQADDVASATYSGRLIRGVGRGILR